MKFPLALLATALLTVTAFAATPDTRLFEMRTYYAAEGKLENMHARFRDHTTKLFAKHGMTNIGYWVPIENPERQLIYVLAYPDRAARDASWKAFGADPDWKKARTESELGGKIVAKSESRFFTATDFSPEVAASPHDAARVFEMRTYTASPGNLANLLERFRSHTVGLFAKHGMTNLYYWQLAAGQPDADKMLVYLLAHASKEAAEASFKTFRADPDWNTARKASEEKGGGSLTAPDGVKSVFLKATDYSPLR
ncbi:MAG TPA: NIPSNAP family protein [Chthoniobacteraceae bacterium]